MQNTAFEQSEFSAEDVSQIPEKSPKQEETPNYPPSLLCLELEHTYTLTHFNIVDTVRQNKLARLRILICMYMVTNME